MDTVKRIGAILAGFITVALLSIFTDGVLEGLHIFPPIGQGVFTTWMLVVALAYRCVYTVIGGYVTAWLAPSSPMLLVKILAGVGTLAALIGLVVGWNLSAHWYPIALVVTAFPCVWLGGSLRSRGTVQVAG